MGGGGDPARENHQGNPSLALATFVKCPVSFKTLLVSFLPHMKNSPYHIQKRPLKISPTSTYENGIFFFLRKDFNGLHCWGPKIRF